MDTSFINQFHQELKDKLAVDQKYQPFEKKLVAYTKTIDPFFAMLSAHKENHEAKYIHEILAINKRYAGHVENFEKSLKRTSEKNQSEIEKSQKEKAHKSQIEHQEFKAKNEALDQDLQSLQKQAKDAIKGIEQTASREISKYRKQIIDIRKAYQVGTHEVEIAREQKRFERVEIFQKNTEILEQSFEEHLLIANEKIKSLKVAAFDNNKANDEIYLMIKTSYNQMTISFNKKISEIKKRYQNELPKLEKTFESQKVPMAKDLEKMKLEYDVAVKASLIAFTNRLNELNNLFDQQKANYEQKKAQIIHESNEAITLLNSKLSAFREAVQKEKHELSKALREEMGTLETEFEKDKLNRKLTKELQNFDNELNKQIIRTNLDIIQKQKEQHARIFELDQKHLKEIHQWRYEKALAEFEKKLDHQKVEINYTHNIKVQEETLKHYIAHHNYHKELLRLTQNLELLPLEYQLAIAASIQERELNILANDAHKSMGEFKHQEFLIDHQLKLDELTNTHQKLIEELNHQNAHQTISAQAQLKLEKLRLSRDYQLEEQELRIELSEIIKNKQIKDIEQKLDFELRQIELKKELLLIEHQDLLTRFKDENTFEQKKREAFIHEARYRNQLRLQHEKSERQLSVHKRELEKHQIEVESIFTLFRKFDSISQMIENVLIDLYHLPCHPEVFKDSLRILSAFERHLNQSLKVFIQDQKARDHAFYLKKIDDSTGYKYMVKHQHVMDNYAIEIQKIKEAKANIDHEISELENHFFMNQSDLERHQVAVENLKSQRAQLKATGMKSEASFQGVREHHKDIHTHEIEIKRIKLALTKIESEIDRKHKAHLPYDKKLDKLLEKQKLVEANLERDKHHEGAFFHRYMHHNQKLYQQLFKLKDQLFEGKQAFYGKLLGELYVSESFLSMAQKSLSRMRDTSHKNLLKIQNHFLDHMLSFYQENKKTQDQLDQTFYKSTHNLILNQKKNYENWIASYDHDLQLKASRTKQLISSQKMKFERINQSDQNTYEKKKALDLETLRMVEKKITDTIAKKELEDQLLEQNLKQVKDQYEFERLSKLKTFDESHQKKIQNHEMKRIQTIRNFEQMIQSLQQKSQAILEKDNQNYTKRLEALKLKKLEFNSHMEREHLSDQERDRALDLRFKQMNLKRQSELKLQNDSFLEFGVSSKIEMEKMYRKDVRILRKSYRFKLKMLHLN